MQAPVLFLVFNRPDTTRMVFDAIRLAKPSRLYVAVDGARSDRPGEAEKVDQVKRIVRAVDWPCVVKKLYRDSNKGCKHAVSEAISWFFENEEMGIILEDDCLPDPTFFAFCDTLLERYRHDDRIMAICGTNLANTDQIKDSYYFSGVPHIWGWASWSRVWQEYDVEMSDLDEVCNSDAAKSHFPKHIWQYWKGFFRDVKGGLVNTWDVQFSYLAIKSGRLSVFPRRNLISNIGFRADATHTTGDSLLANRVVYPMESSLNHPVVFQTNLIAMRERQRVEAMGVPRCLRIAMSLTSWRGIKIAGAKILNIIN